MEGYTRVSTHRGWIDEVLAGEHEDGSIALSAMRAKRKEVRSR
jgi:hypothetical protein